MINLNDDRGDPHWNSPTRQDKLDFVSLSTETTANILGGTSTVPSRGVVLDPPPASPTGFLDQWQRSLLGSDEDGKPLLKSKFEVPWQTVKAELIFALTGADTLLPTGLSSRWAASSSGGGVLSDISANFQGDWWAPLWISMTLSICMLISAHSDKILIRKSADLSLGRVLFAFLVPYIFIAAVYTLLRTFTHIVVRDATFFGTPQQRRKWISIAGYALTPVVAITALDGLLGLVQLPRRGFIHIIFLSLAALPSFVYVDKRFPIRAIGGFAQRWDRRSAQMMFWLGYATIFYSLIFTLHNYFS